MITSPDNEKLKTARKLRQKKHRERLGLFVTEGEDLAEAGLAAGRQPEAMLVHPESGIDGEPVEPGLLDRASGLGSGTRVIGIWPVEWATEASGTCVFLDGVADPGNVGTILRTVDSLLEATVVLGPGSADPFSPGAVRASMGSVFSQPVVRAGVETTPEPRIAMVLAGGERPGPAQGPLTLCLGSEREGLSGPVLKQCSQSWSIPLRKAGPESLNVSAAAAIACERISSPPPGPQSS